MKILLRASASPRAARPPRLTSVPIKHRNRKKPNFIIIFRPAAAARPLRLRLAPGSPKEIRAPVLPPPAYLGKPRATVTALYSTQAQARLIFTALPQSQCPYLNHIQVVKCGRRRYVTVLHPSSIGKLYRKPPRRRRSRHGADEPLGRPRTLDTRATGAPPRQVPKLDPRDPHILVWGLRPARGGRSRSGRAPVRGHGRAPSSAPASGRKSESAGTYAARPLRMWTRFASHAFLSAFMADPCMPSRRASSFSTASPPLAIIFAT